MLLCVGSVEFTEYYDGLAKRVASEVEMDGSPRKKRFYWDFKNKEQIRYERILLLMKWIKWQVDHWVFLRNKPWNARKLGRYDTHEKFQVIGAILAWWRSNSSNNQSMNLQQIRGKMIPTLGFEHGGCLSLPYAWVQSYPIPTIGSSHLPHWKLYVYSLTED